MLDIETSLQRGLVYLQRQQLADGGFASYSSPSATSFQAEYKYRTTFIPSLMLGSLSKLPGEIAAMLRGKLAHFIDQQIEVSGAVNYWAEESPERMSRPYPDDLDDTSCAYIGLLLNDPESVRPERIAQLVRLLIANEARPGGPYRTWLIPPDNIDAVWCDIDPAVNANIAYLLSLISQPPRGLVTYLQKMVSQNRLSSPYYPSAYPLLYYLARFNHSLKLTGLAELAVAFRPKPEDSSMHRALYLSVTLWLGGDKTEQLVNQLIDTQKSDGSWPTAAFCQDPSRKGRAYFDGSASLTTAFALEALCLYQTNRAAVSPKPPVLTHSMPSILSCLRRQSHHLSSELRNDMVTYAEKLCHSPAGPEITNLTALCNEALLKPLEKSSSWLARLGTSNLFGWIAYTIFDDIMDGDDETQQLPLATAALRLAVNGFESALPNDRAFLKYNQQLFCRMDNANARELAHYRLLIKDSRLTINQLSGHRRLISLADRSAGHIIGPLAVMRRGSVPDLQVKQFKRALGHYLAARQLNDDLHDWEQDLAKGRVSYVVACLLSDALVEPSAYDIKQLLLRLQPTFWATTLPRISDRILYQSARSRSCLQSLSAFKNSYFLHDYLDAIDRSVAATKLKRNEAAAFLRAYNRG